MSMRHIEIPQYKAMATVSDDCPEETIGALIELCRLAYNGLPVSHILKKHDFYEDDDLPDDRDFYEDLEEQRQEELADIARECTCGAWVFNKKGNVKHVSDCICGAQ